MANSKRKSETDPVAAGIKVIASKSCPSLSGNCTIAYKLGRDADDALHIRLHENTGGGFFNGGWYPAKTIVDLLRAEGKVESVTSRVIAPLFRGRSANSPAFLTAVLRNEGVLLPYKRTSRRHIIGDLDAFLKQSGDVPSKPKRKAQAKPTKTAKTTPRKTTKKTPAKKQ